MVMTRLNIWFKKYFWIRRYQARIFSGLGFSQGLGIDIETDNIKVGQWLNIVTQVRVQSDGEWLNKLKEKLK